MARGNPYAFDPNLMAGFSNLTKALIGSAADDAALARAKASEAAAQASTSRAGLYDSQKVGVNQTNAMNAELYRMGNELSKDPAFQSQIAQALGLDTLASGFMGPPAPGQIRLGTDNANAMARTALGTYGNAEQMTGAFNNVGEGADSSLARSMILSGTDDEAARGALMMSPGGGQYQNPGFAELELRTNDATNQRDDTLDYNAELNEDRLRFGVGGQGDRDTTTQENTKVENNKRDNLTKEREQDLRYGEGGQGDRDTAAQERWEQYKADKAYDAKIYDTDKDDSLARWQHENRDIEISVEPGKQIVLNPDAAKILGVPQQDNGLYILDGGPKPGAIIVKVGKEDVYLTEEDAKRLGIKKNDAGQYVIPGKPELAPKGGSGSGSGGGKANVGQGNVLDMTRYQEQFKKDVVAYIDPETPLPGHALGAMLTISEKMIRDDLKDDAEMNVNTAYSRNVIPMLSAGGYNIGGGYFKDGLNVPRYFIDYFARMPENAFNNAIAAGQDGAPSQFASLWTQQMRYSQDELQAIFEEVQRLRK